MLCKNPLQLKGNPYDIGCGQCMHCRVNRSRKWVSRMMLERLCHSEAAFVTLTISDEHLSQNLKKEELSDFLKRLRGYLQGRVIRYFAVGEYGSRTGRPHYHLIVFGLSPTEGEIVEKAWKKGFVYMGTAQLQSMNYVCSYLIKGMTKKDDVRLDGREPEFAVMSLRPGLGAYAVERLAEAYKTREGQKAVSDIGWIGETVHIGKSRYTLDRYMQGKLAQRIGLDKVDEKAHKRKKVLRVCGEKAAAGSAYQGLRESRVAAQMGKLKAKQEVL